MNMLTDFGHQSQSSTSALPLESKKFPAPCSRRSPRHRIASFSVQSQRYVKEKQFSFVTPPQIAENEQAAELYQKAMQSAHETYMQLADILQKKNYQEMIAQGMDEKKAKSASEKKAIEDARFVLPNACDTKMILTMNARSLLNFFHLRCCNRAQWEIRDVATQMLKLVKPIAPTIFAKAGPGCLSGLVRKAR